MSINVLRSCCYPFKYPTNGGIHRSEQIRELLVSHDIKVAELDQVVYEHLNPISSRFWGAVDSLRKGDLESFHTGRLGSIGQSLARCQYALKSERYNALIWETVGESLTLGLAKKNSLPVIALPSNLEAFCKVLMQGRPSTRVLHYLKQEVTGLKQADAVFTISIEEQILYRNFGVEANYLPYYPPQRLIDFYTEIRRQREITEPQHYLILGSVINQLTYEGVAELLTWLMDTTGSQTPKIVLAGNGTETLKGQWNFPWLKICGTVSQPELRDLLISSKAVLVHQKRGLGFLTRIPDMLVAGIPVIVS